MIVKLLTSALLTFGLVATAVANDRWKPSQPIEVVIPHPPGGATDRWGRAIAQILDQHGWPTLISNRPGADTMIASTYVAKAKPDGHVLYINGGTGFLMANLPDKPSGVEFNANSFSDIATIGSGSFVLVCSSNVPVTNYAEFLTYIKANPTQFNLGFYNGQMTGLFNVWADREGLARPTMAIYKGSAPMKLDVQGGHLPFAFDTFNSVAPLLSEGKIRLLAVIDHDGAKTIEKILGRKELPVLGKRIPEIDLNLYYGLVGPAGMDKNIINEINRVVVSGLSDPKNTQSLNEVNLWVSPSTPGAMTQQREKWWSLYQKFISAR